MTFGQKKERGCLLMFCLLGLLVWLATSCAFFDLFDTSIPMNKDISDKLEFTDKYSQDSNGRIFYWDYYEFRMRSEKNYSLELWTDSGVPMHFECKTFGVDMGAWDDGDKTWDGYLKYVFPTNHTGKVGFDFYLRSDHVSSRSWYRFRVNEN